MISKILKAVESRLDPGWKAEDITDQLNIIQTRSFVFVIQDSKQTHRGNVRLIVLNNKAEVIDDRVYYNAAKGEKLSKAKYGKYVMVDARKRLD